MKFKAKTLEGEEVEGWHVISPNGKNHFIDSWIENLSHHYEIDHNEIDPTTLRLLINGKEYTMEELESIVETFESDYNY